MDEEYLTVAEIAELLKLNEQTIRNTIDRGELPAIRFGSRRVRVRRSDLDEFIAASSRRRQPSTRRAEYDGALNTAAMTLRRTGGKGAAEALRSLSKAAIALADELDDH